MTRDVLTALFGLTPDLAARLGRFLVVALLLLLFPAAVLLAVMASACAAAGPSNKRRGKSNLEHLAAFWAWLQPSLPSCRQWLLAKSSRYGWLLLTLLGLGSKPGPACAGWLSSSWCCWAPSSWRFCSHKLVPFLPAPPEPDLPPHVLPDCSFIPNSGGRMPFASEWVEPELFLDWRGVLTADGIVSTSSA
jgi:hypothetical protein